MNITKNQIDDLNLTLKIELGKDDYAEGVQKTLKDYQKKAVVNGFRQGKTPMGIVKKMYGPAVMADEINKVLFGAMENYIKDNDLHILGEPLPNEEHSKEMNLNQENFEFFFDVALSPEVNAKLSKREKLPYYVITVDDEMIDKQIEGICKGQGNMVEADVIEGDEYLKGELIELDENGDIKENGIKNEDASMSLHFMKDEDAVKLFNGKKAGEEVKFNAAKAYPNKTDFTAMLGVSKEEAEKAGENYCFIIKEIKRFVDAEVNEELFAKLYGEGVVKDEADFRSRVKADIEKQLKEHSEYRFTIDAKEKFVKKNEDVVLPEAFLKRWIVSVNEGMKAEDVEKDFEGYRGEFKWQLVKSQITRDFELKIEDEDVKAEARKIAAAQLQQYGLFGLTNEQLDGFAAKLLENSNQRSHLAEKALDVKIFNTIRENVKLEEQEISMADFEKLFQK